MPTIDSFDGGTLVAMDLRTMNDVGEISCISMDKDSMNMVLGECSPEVSILHKIRLSKLLELKWKVDDCFDSGYGKFVGCHRMGGSQTVRYTKQGTLVQGRGLCLTNTPGTGLSWEICVKDHSGQQFYFDIVFHPDQLHT